MYRYISDPNATFAVVLLLPDGPNATSVVMLLPDGPNATSVALMLQRGPFDTVLRSFFYIHSIQ